MGSDRPHVSPALVELFAWFRSAREDGKLPALPLRLTPWSRPWPRGAYAAMERRIALASNGNYCADTIFIRRELEQLKQYVKPPTAGN